jgi:hypothetical protein
LALGAPAMADINSYGNKFCAYFIKYRYDYAGITGNNLGGYKNVNNDTDYIDLIKILKIEEIKKDNILTVIMRMFDLINLDKFTGNILLFLQDMINLGENKKFMEAKFNKTQIQQLSNIYQNYCAKFNEEARTKLLSSVNVTKINLENDNLVNNNDQTMGLMNLISKHLSDLENKLMSKLDEKINDKIKSTCHNDDVLLLSQNSNNTNNNSNSINLGNNENNIPILQSKVNLGNDNTISFNFEKMLKAKHHINIMRLHIDNETSPTSLFFNRFPQPFFIHDEEYIERYNNRIKTFQLDVMNDIISVCEKR